MTKSVKKLAQYSSAIAGTHHHMTTDVIQLDSKQLLAYYREDNGSFEFKIIKRCNYNQKTFDLIIKKPGHSQSELFFHLWRSHMVKEPKFMPDRYYSDIYKLNTMYLNINSRHVRMVNNEIQKLKDELLKENFGIIIEKDRSY